MKFVKKSIFMMIRNKAVHKIRRLIKCRYLGKENHIDIEELMRIEGVNEHNKGLILAGAGEYGRLWMEKLQYEDMRVLCFVDKNKAGQMLCGKWIISYSDLKKIKGKISIFITARGDTKKEIENLLIKMGLGEQIIENPYIGCNIDLQSRIHNSYMEGNNLLLKEAELINSYLGRCSYLSAGAKLVYTKVGRYSCIGPDVRIIIGQHPTSRIVSVHPAFYSTKNTIGYSYVQNDKFDENRFIDQQYAVLIGNDVWIGMGARLMEGITIADGSIIGAGAVVVKSTKPYEIVGGVPARHIKYRFEEEERNRLLELKWWDKDLKWIQEYAEKFEDIKQFLN